MHNKHVIIRRTNQMSITQPKVEGNVGECLSKETRSASKNEPSST